MDSVQHSNKSWMDPIVANQRFDFRLGLGFVLELLAC